MPFPKWNIGIDTVASLEYAHINKCIAYVTTHERKAPTYWLFRNKAPKTQQVDGFTPSRKASDIFSFHQSACCILCRENFAY